MTSISKNTYIDKLDNIINKYNNTYHSTMKIKPVDARSSLVKKLITKIRNLKLVILLEFQNIKTIWQKAMFQISLKKFLWLKSLKKISVDMLLVK